MSIVTGILAGTTIPVNPTQPNGTGKINTIINIIAWGCVAACLVGLLWGGAKLAISHHRGMGSGEGASHIAGVLLGCVIIGSASTVVAQLT
jgi:TRAP-type C4-dicarboxylate transport system permease small subunit